MYARRSTYRNRVRFIYSFYGRSLRPPGGPEPFIRNPVRKSAEPHGPAFVSYTCNLFVSDPFFCTSMAKYGRGMPYSALTSIFGVACCLIGVEEQYISRQKRISEQHNTCTKTTGSACPPHFSISLTFSYVIAICVLGVAFGVSLWSPSWIAPYQASPVHPRELTPCSRNGGYCARVSTISWSTRPAQPSLVSFNQRPTSLESYTYTAYYDPIPNLELSVPHHTCVRQHEYRRVVPTIARKGGCYW